MNYGFFLDTGDPGEGIKGSRSATTPMSQPPQVTKFDNLGAQFLFFARSARQPRLPGLVGSPIGQATAPTFASQGQPTGRLARNVRPMPIEALFRLQSSIHRWHLVRLWQVQER